MKTINERLIPLIAEQLCVPLVEVTHDKTFAELGADSLDTVEIVMALEDEFAIAINDDEWDEITSVQKALDLVTRKTTATA